MQERQAARIYCSPFPHPTFKNLFPASLQCITSNGMMLMHNTYIIPLHNRISNRGKYKVTEVTGA